LERLQHAVRLESLPDEVSVEPLQFAVVGDFRPTAQPFIERGLEQGVSVQTGERLIEGALRSSGVDAGPFHLHSDALSAPAAYRGFRACNRAGHSCVVYGVFLDEASDGLVDVRGRVSAASQPLTDLRFGQLAAGEQFQAFQVSLVSSQTV
jgi:hypothetical protein